MTPSTWLESWKEGLWASAEDQYLSSLLRQTANANLPLPAEGGSPETLRLLLRMNQEFLEHLGAVEAFLRSSEHFTIVDQSSRKFRNLRVSVPSVVTVSVSALVERNPQLREAADAWKDSMEALSEYPIAEFIRSERAKCLRKASVLRDAAKLLAWLLAHKEECRGLLPCQIPHGLSTKLIQREGLLCQLFAFCVQSVETPEGAPLAAREGAFFDQAERTKGRGKVVDWEAFVRFFWLAPKPRSFRFYAQRHRIDGQCLAPNLVLDVDEVTSARIDFAQFSRILIVENEGAFHASKTIIQPSDMLVFGGGYGVVDVGSVLTSFRGLVFYWGDMDADGLLIGALLKERLPQATLLCMDFGTLESHRHLSQKDRARGAPGARGLSLPENAAPELQRLFAEIRASDIRIEQEQLPLSYVAGQLEARAARN